ncbi:MULTISPECIES: SusC/RagA family TonB-linked outer membrane protein [Chitinophagaceae]|uniref:SusC/RagA family TonB-linked outer membrane protein n=1 Tax=Chitinophagaceae TaxID=563835 RepID=UPI001958E20C|nr:MULTISPECIES: TonB-dependent receptor [Chitinophagaceae]
MKSMAKKSLQQLLIALCFVFCAGLQSAAQNRVVSGKVTEQGDTTGLAGVSVTAKGTTTGTQTAADGSFSLSVPGNAQTLVFSAVGYGTTEATITAGQMLVSLQAVAVNMNEVVVVGYGTQRKEAVTGSVATISGNAVRDVPSPNITQALQGRMAGVDISQTSTRPGATMQIRIRGTRSLTGSNDPLIVLDGIPFMGSLADINPNDIRSVDVLKDASATAIYGSRGANGVILVTTDKGARGRKPRIAYNAYHGVQTVFAQYPMMDGPKFTALRKAAGQYVNGQDEADNINTDWQDLFYRNGFVTDHNISLSGATDGGNYNFGGGYYQNQGVIPTQQYKRYSLRGSLDQQVGKAFRFGFTTNNNYNQSEGNQVGLYNTLSMTPISSPYNEDGSLRRGIRMIADNQYVYTKDVLENLRDNSQWLNETRGFASYNSIYGEVQIPYVKGLKYRANVGLNYTQSNNGSYTGAGVGDALNPNTPSGASVDNRYTYHWTVENLLTYDRVFAGKHSVNAVALYSAEQQKFTRSNMAARDIPADAFQFYNLGQAAGQITIDPALQQYQLWGLMSMMGRVMYAYDNRYMISATVRSDGSSRLAPGNKWHTYPALSVGWNIAKERFMENITAINSLKLRAGYGQTSNQAVPVYSTLGLLSTRPYNFGPTTYSTGYFVSQIPNPGLGWEYSQTYNFGVDFSLLKNRLSGSLEYYITNTEGVLQSVSLPSTSGVGSIVQNVGEIQNKGVEFSLNGNVLNDVNGWTWDVGFNVYANRNKLKALASGATRDEANWWFVGKNINAIYDYKRVGLWQDKDEHRAILEPGGNVGMIKVEYTGEYNPDGTPKRAISPADRQVMNVDPDFQGGFNTRVAYKGFDLGVVGVFRSGGVLVSTIHGPNGYLNLLSGRRNNIDVDYWTPENTDAKYPKPGGIISGDNPKYASTLAYFDGSFAKIRTITLGYDFNRSIIQNDNIRLRMYFTAQNPFVFFSPFHKESGLDPETNSMGNENTATSGFAIPNRVLTVGFNTPSTRNYILGLNLSF